MNYVLYLQRKGKKHEKCVLMASVVHFFTCELQGVRKGGGEEEVKDGD